MRKKKAFIQKEGKEKDEKRERENPDDERRHKIISSLVLFLFLFRSFNEEEHLSREDDDGEEIGKER